jgi:hypothetical protein
MRRESFLEQRQEFVPRAVETAHAGVGLRPYKVQLLPPKDRRELSGFTHSSGSPALRMPSMRRSRCARNTALSLSTPVRKRRSVNFGLTASPARTFVPDFCAVFHGADPKLTSFTELEAVIHHSMEGEGTNRLIEANPEPSPTVPRHKDRLFQRLRRLRPPIHDMP